MKHITKIALAAALLLTQCKSELDGKPAAKVADAKVAETKGADAGKGADVKAPAGEAKAFKLDAGASKIGFVGRKLTGDHTGDFKAFSGEAKVAGKEPTEVTFTVETGSVSSDAEDLTKHLKSPDFFDVEKFPKASFASTNIAAKAGTDGTTHEITGDLELHGVKKSITFPAKITVDERGAKGAAEFTINRKDFGIVYPGKPDDLIKDEVLLKLDLQFVGA
jgi:polyisoprenoid-binding protein YceI